MKSYSLVFLKRLWLGDLNGIYYCCSNQITIYYLYQNMYIHIDSCLSQEKTSMFQLIISNNGIFRLNSNEKILLMYSNHY